jgi:hypothetical protein
MKLSDRQLNYFRTFGFLTFPGHFADEIDDVTDAFEKVWADHSGGHGNTATTTSAGRRWSRSSTRTSTSARSSTTPA